MGSCHSQECAAGSSRANTASSEHNDTASTVRGGGLLHGLLEPAACEGRVRRTSRGADVIFKPVFSHRPEYPAAQREVEVLRAVSALPLGDDAASSAARKELLLQWANAPRSPVPPALRPQQQLPDAAPLSSAPTAPNATHTACTISLAEVDRGSREAPYAMGACTTNLSCVWIRAFNVVKLFLHHESCDSGPDTPDELLNEAEFRMLLSYAAYYLIAMVLVDADAPLHTASVAPIVTAVGVADDSGTAGGVSPVPPVLVTGAPAVTRSGPFRVSSLFFDEHVAPLLLTATAPGAVDGTVIAEPHQPPVVAHQQRKVANTSPLCDYIPHWRSLNEVPAAFRQLLAQPAASLFRELDKLVPVLELRSPSKRDLTKLVPTQVPCLDPNARDATCPSQELCDYIGRAMLATAFSPVSH